MLSNLITLICSMIGSIIMTYIYCYSLEIEQNSKISKKIIGVILLTIIIFFTVRIKYNAESILLKLTLFVIVLKLLYKRSVYKTIITILITIMLISIGDLASTLVFVNFISVEEMKSIWYWILICNISVYTITILLFSIPVIKKKIIKFISNQNDDGKVQTMLIFILTAVVIVYILYNISLNYEWSEKYLINVLIATTYIVIVGIFLKDKSDYYNLMKEYDTLFEYFKELEDSIENISLVNHEYKNQLAIIKSYIKDNKKKEAIEYLNEIIKEINIEDESVLSELKYIPKGGIKGLLYYKIITAKNKNVTIVLDISRKTKKLLEKLTYEENKIITRALGVYIDNSIDAVKDLKRSIVTVEIYNINNEINIVISNPFINDQIDAKKISKKGYTTKGYGHGKGLYLIKKMINKKKSFSTETKILNDYFIQKLTIIK